MKRLQQIETSALTEEQIHVLRTRILPSLEEMTKGHFSWYLPGPEQKQEAVRAVKHNWAVMTWLLQAIVSKGTQAQRARNLMNHLSKDHIPRWRAVDPYKQYILAYNRTMELIAAKKINSEAAKAIAAILQSTDFQLLKKSWRFIIDEAINEFKAIIKAKKLFVLPKFDYTRRPASGAQVERRKQKFIDYAGSLGFKITPTVENRTDAKWEQGAVHMKRGDIYLTWLNDRIKPEYVFNGRVYNWERIGVDDGAEEVEGILQAVVDDCIEKAEKALAARVELQANGAEYNLGGNTVRWLPETRDQVVKKLRDGGTHTIGSGGFGTYTMYSTRQYRLAKPASEWLSQAVGQPVYFWREERD